MLDHIQKKRQELSNNIQKSYNPDHDYLEKGKRAEIGEVRMWGNEKWVKHQDGWVHLNEKTGKHKLERPGGKREDAGDHHVSHAKTHLDRHEREGGIHKKNSEDENGIIDVTGNPETKIPEEDNKSLRKDLLSILDKTSEKGITVEDWLKQLGVDSTTLSKEKDSFLDSPIYFSNQTTINYSGSWGVPSPTQTYTYFVSGEEMSSDKIKSIISDKKEEEREHRKRQKEKEKNHDYRFQKPSSTTTEYGSTTLRKILKKFDERPRSSHGTMSSSYYNYNIRKIS